MTASSMPSRTAIKSSRWKALFMEGGENIILRWQKLNLVQITAMRGPLGICDGFTLTKDEQNHRIVGSCLQSSLVRSGQLCDCPASMASSIDPPNKKTSCPHLRLILEQGPTA